MEMEEEYVKTDTTFALLNRAKKTVTITATVEGEMSS